MRSDPGFDGFPGHSQTRANQSNQDQNVGALPVAWRHAPHPLDTDRPTVADPSDAPSSGASGLELGEIAQNYNVKSITPRQMVTMSFDLYFSGHVSREHYTELAFQSELMPNFDATIGALIGAKAAPDKPRDYTLIWRARLKFEMEHCVDSQRIVERTQKILDLLESIDKSAKSLRRSKYLGMKRRMPAQPTLKKRHVSKAVRPVVLPPLGLGRGPGR